LKVDGFEDDDAGGNDAGPPAGAGVDDDDAMYGDATPPAAAVEEPWLWL
jgi:hypothetical protein